VPREIVAVAAGEPGAVLVFYFMRFAPAAGHEATCAVALVFIVTYSAYWLRVLQQQRLLMHTKSRVNVQCLVPTLMALLSKAPRVLETRF
jgi:hypothetical protein